MQRIGLLKVQKVDIGSLVKEGDVLAEIDAPEYVQSRDQAKAEVEQAKAKLQLANAAVVRAQADVGAAEAGVAEKSRADAGQSLPLLPQDPVRTHDATSSS